MKEILLKIDDKVFKDLQNTMGIRDMMGNAYGLVDGLVSKIITSVENEEKELELIYKKDRE